MSATLDEGLRTVLHEKLMGNWSLAGTTAGDVGLTQEWGSRHSGNYERRTIWVPRAVMKMPSEKIAQVVADIIDVSNEMKGG